MAGANISTDKKNFKSKTRVKLRSTAIRDAFLIGVFKNKSYSPHPKIAPTGKNIEPGNSTSRDYYKELYENAPYTTLFIGTDSRIEKCNRHSEQLLGCCRDEILGRSFLDLYTETQYGKEKAAKIFKLVTFGMPVTEVKVQMQKKDGAVLWVSQSMYPIINDKNINTGCISIIVNIDKEKKADDKIKQQNEFLENVIESLTYPFYVIDAKDYSIKLANSAAKYSVSSGSLTCYQLTHRRESPCNGKKHACPLQEVKRTKRPCIVEHIHYDRNGGKRNIEVHAYPILDNSANVIQMLEYSLDITERKRAEAEVKRLSSEIMVSQEKERERVAKDIHDGVIQTILTAKLNFKAYQDDPEGAFDRLEIGLIFMDKANKELREICNDLYPSILNDLGLEIAIKWHIKNTLELYGIRTELRFDIMEKLRHDIEVNLYRMIQEISSNIIKYSQADKVYMELLQKNGSIQLVVEDNGRGFSEDELNNARRGFGLSNLRQRSESFGGSINIESSPGRGARIFISIPTWRNNEKSSSISC